MSAIDSKGLPCNLDAERFVLGSILLDDSRFLEIASALKNADFSLEKHRRIFQRMADLSERGERIDRVTVANELMSNGQLESCDGLDYLVSLDDGLPRIHNVESYVRIVKDKSQRRRAIFLLEDVKNKLVIGQESTDELVSTAEGMLREIGLAGAAQQDMRSGAEIIEGYGGMDKFFEPPADGISTPWPTVNRYTRGLHPGDLILLGGRPSTGKTTAALNIVLHAVKRGTGTLLFSLETRDKAILLKLACIASEVPLADLRDGLSAAQRRKVTEVIEPLSKRLRISRWPIASPKRVHSEVRRAKSERSRFGGDRLVS